MPTPINGSIPLPSSLPSSLPSAAAAAPASTRAGQTEPTIDSDIRALTLNGQDAIRLLSEPSGLNHVQDIVLDGCISADVAHIATLLAASPDKKYGISLARYHHHARNDTRLSASERVLHTINDNSLCALARADLKSLNLKDFNFSPAVGAALSQQPCPISIDITYSHQPDTHLISQIPSLTSLSVGMHPLSQSAVSALSSHPSLTTLKLHSVDADTLGELLANPTLQTLHVRQIIGNAAVVYEAIANHPHLTTIDLPVADTTSVAAIARNVRLRTIALHPRSAAIPALPLLAALPNLESLNVASMGAVFPAPLKAEHLLAFHAIPLKSLTVTLLAMDHSTYSALVTSRTNKLTFWCDKPFGHEHVALLNRNAAITSLDIQGGIDEAQATQLFQDLHPNLIELSLTVFIKRPKDWTPDVESAAIFKNVLSAQWVAAGKSAEKLAVTVRRMG